MSKKEILSLLLLSLVLVLIVGCGKEESPDVLVEKPLTEEAIKVNVIVSNNVSESVLNSLKEKGLTVALETGGSLILTGEVNQTEFEELKNDSELKYVKEGKSGGGQTSSLEDQQLIDEARARMNITVGPLIDQEVWDEVNKNDQAYVGARFRIADDEAVYQNNINKIKAVLTNEELNSMEILGVGRAFRVIIGKDSLNKLKEDRNLLEIGLVHK